MIKTRLNEITTEERKKRRNRLRLDFAYGCFALLGLTVMAGMAVDLADKGNREGYAMLVTLLLGPPALGASVTAIVLTVMSWRHWPIVVLCLITILLVALKAAGDLSNCCSEGASERAMDAIVWIYAAVAVIVPVWWFAVGRRRPGWGAHAHSEVAD